MTTAQVVETSVTTNSLSKDYLHIRTITQDKQLILCHHILVQATVSDNRQLLKQGINLSKEFSVNVLQ